MHVSVSFLLYHMHDPQVNESYLYSLLTVNLWESLRKSPRFLSFFLLSRGDFPQFLFSGNRILFVFFVDKVPREY